MIAIDYGHGSATTETSTWETGRPWLSTTWSHDRYQTYGEVSYRVLETYEVPDEHGDTPSRKAMRISQSREATEATDARHRARPVTEAHLAPKPAPRPTKRRTATGVRNWQKR